MYLPCLKSDFLNWDDDVHLLENVSVRSLDAEHIQKIFRSRVNNIYIPLTVLSFAVEHHFFGYDPFFYHLDNLLLHLLNTFLLFMFAMCCGLSIVGATMAALLFGLHPIHVESVAWVTERKDVLYAFFYLAALLTYWRYLESERKWFYILTIVLGILSVLAKPMAISLPFILLLCDWFHGRKWTRFVFIEKIPYLLFSALIGWVTYSAHARLPGENLFAGALIWIWSFMFYLRQFLWPAFLVPIYKLPLPIEIINGEYLLSLVALFLFVFLVTRFKKYKWVVFAFAFYVLSIFFLLRYDDAVDLNIVADRFMYLPILGFCLLFGRGCQHLWGKVANKSRLYKRLVLGGGLFLAIFLSVQTFKQCQIWQNSITLWRHQLHFYPEEPVALNNLATALRDAESYQEAERQYKMILKMQTEGIDIKMMSNASGVINQIKGIINLYKKAININSIYVDAHYNLGHLYEDIGRQQDALEAYEKALSINPAHKDSYYKLGHLYQELGQAQKAVMAYSQIIRSNPSDEDGYLNLIKTYSEIIKEEPQNLIYRKARESVLEAYADLINSKGSNSVSFFNMGVVHNEIGDPLSAIRYYQRALEINPNYCDALYNLGNTYEQIGYVKEAISSYEKVVELSPRYADAYLNLGVIYSSLGQKQKAESFFQKVVAVDPHNSTAYFNLGFIFETKGEFQKAREFYEKTIQFNPKHEEAYYNIGNVLANLGRNKEAILFYQKAITVNPNHVNAFVNLSVLSFRDKEFQKAIEYLDEARILGYDAPKEYVRALERYRR